MSIFGEDLIDDIIGGNDDPLNENIVPDDNIDEVEIQSGDDDAENKGNADEKSTKIEAKKRSVRNPRPRLNFDILTGNRGIHTIENYFKDIKFGGKGHEKHDLDEILKRLQHWAHRMYPVYKFDDILTNVERLSRKKQLQHYMNNYRQGRLAVNKENEIREADDDEAPNEEPEPFDEFDALINQQIAISKLPLLPMTPSTSRVNTTTSSSVIDTPRFARQTGETSTPHRNHDDYTIISSQQPDDNIHKSEIVQLESLEQPVSAQQQQTKTGRIPDFLKNRSDLTEEQIARIAENRRIALERLKAKKAAMNAQ